MTRKYDYRAFGEQLTLYEAPETGEASGYPKNPFGFTGREIEHGTDLYHYRARSYDSMVGRFLSGDSYISMVMVGQGLSNASTGGLNPLVMGAGSCGAGCGMGGAGSFRNSVSSGLSNLLVNPQKLNPQIYVLNNPQRFIDPWGLYTIVITIFGSSEPHSALFIENVDGATLYDPAGSYAGSVHSINECVIQGDDANIARYLKHQRDGGNKIILQGFDTTPNEEEKIIETARILGGFPGLCAFNVSKSLMEGADIFKGLRWYQRFTPLGLSQGLKALLRQQADECE